MAMQHANMHHVSMAQGNMHLAGAQEPVDRVQGAVQTGIDTTPDTTPEATLSDVKGTARKQEQVAQTALTDKELIKSGGLEQNPHNARAPSISPGSGSRASDKKASGEPSSQETSSSLLMEYLSFDIPKHGDQEETPEDESSAARTDNFGKYNFAQRISDHHSKQKTIAHQVVSIDSATWQQPCSGARTGVGGLSFPCPRTRS